MHELLQKALHGVDPNAPGAFWQIFANLWQLMPWGLLFWSTVLCVLVGAVLGWWKDRLLEGVLLGFVFGPLGWIIVLRPRRQAGVHPPPLPRR